MSALCFKTWLSQRKHVSFFTSGNKWTSSLRINSSTFEESGSKFQEFRVFAVTVLIIGEVTLYHLRKLLEPYLLEFTAVFVFKQLYFATKYYKKKIV